MLATAINSWKSSHLSPVWNLLKDASLILSSTTALLRSSFGVKSYRISLKYPSPYKLLIPLWIYSSFNVSFGYKPKLFNIKSSFNDSDYVISDL